MKQLDKKGLKKLHKWIRAIIQLLYFLFLPSAYTAAFAGVKYIFTQIGNGARVELTSFVTVLIVLCVYTVVFGRFFCGFACAFGSLGDAVHALYVWICKKLKKETDQIKSEADRRIVLYEICGAGSDRDPLLCRSFWKNTGNKSVGSILHASCGKF